MPSLRHTHQYVLYKGRSGKGFYERTYKCIHPNCTHYIDVERIIGKFSICNTCGQEFILDKEALKRVKPNCTNCADTKKGRATRAAQEVLSNLMKSLEIEEEAGEYPDIMQND